MLSAHDLDSLANGLANLMTLHAKCRGFGLKTLAGECLAVAEAMQTLHADIVASGAVPASMTITEQAALMDEIAESLSQTVVGRMALRQALSTASGKVSEDVEVSSSGRRHQKRIPIETGNGAAVSAAGSKHRPSLT